MHRSRGRRDEGSALVLVVIMLAILTPLVMVLLQMGATRTTAEAHASTTLMRAYAAEAGLARARYMVARHTNRVTDENWLRDVASADPDAMTAVQWEDGQRHFVHPGGPRGAAQVRVFVVRLSPLQNPYSSWFLVVSRAEARDPDGTVHATSLAQTMRTTSSFAKYARFVSQQNLSVGAGAHYFGEVHSNANISAANNTVVFHENVSAHGNITGGPTVLKESATGVPQITMPSEEQLVSLTQEAPGGAMVFDTTDAAFRAAFHAATGHMPSSGNPTEVHLKWKGDVMDVTVRVRISGTWRTWTRTDEAIPFNGTMFVRGDAYNEGNFASRVTVAATDRIFVTDPIRYVNTAGDPQYTLYKSGSPAAFDASNNEWTDTADWRGNAFDYRKTDGWTAPQAAGVTFDPSLGLVALNNIVVRTDGIVNNAEYHAAFFSSSGTVTSDGATGKRNLYMLGTMITTGTMPMSGHWSFRNYVYDIGFVENPPPAFPTVELPTFKNWHELGTEPVSGHVFRLTRSDAKTAFGL